MNHRIGWIVGSVAIGVGLVSACYRPYPDIVQRRPVTTRDSHDTFFPINAGAHDGADCNACHGLFDSFTRFSCVTCHDHAEPAMDAIHTAITNYVFSETSCYDCHPRGEGLSREAHDTYFPILAGNHQTIACADCHIVGFASFTCFGCHAHGCPDVTPNHVGLAAFACEDPKCLACHPRGQTMARGDHDAYFPIVAGNHAAVTCVSCHVNGFNPGGYTCFGCHNHDCPTESPGHANIPGFACVDASCLGCHPKGQTMTRDQHAAYFPIMTGNHAATPCADCHTGGFGPGGYTCFGCHSHDCPGETPNHAGVSGFNCTDTSCLSCHPQGESMTRAQHLARFPIDSGNHAAIPCTSCHVNGFGPGSYTCFGCHSHDCATETPNHTGVSDFNCTDSTCLSCHPKGTTMTRVQHAAYFPITSGNHAAVACADCHVNGYNPGGYTCFGCHSHDCATVSPNHAEVSGFSCVDSQCYACHPAGIRSGD
jgi:hypothetical protein